MDTIQVQQLSTINTCTPCFLDKETGRIHILQVPDARLTGISSICIQSMKDIERIPIKTPGIYWISTNEPIHHCLNKGVNLPVKIDDHFQIVYSGSSCDLRDRAKQHLLRVNGVYGTMSGISVDILQTQPTSKSSHAKCLWSNAKKKKLPKLLKSGKYIKPLNKEDIIDIIDIIHLSPDEKSYILKTNEIFFKNGINVEDNKHRPHEWIFHYAPVMNHSIRDYIEIAWRKSHGVPILCSYSEGR